MSALDELKAMIREKGGNTNVASLAEALREYNKYDDASGCGSGTSLVELKLQYEYQEEEGVYVFELIENDEGDSVTGETILQYVENGQIPYIMFPTSDENGHLDDTLKTPMIFYSMMPTGDGMGNAVYQVTFGDIRFVSSSLTLTDPLRAEWEF